MNLLYSGYLSLPFYGMSLGLYEVAARETIPIGGRGIGYSEARIVFPRLQLPLRIYQVHNMYGRMDVHMDT